MRADLHAFDYCAAHQAACVNIEGEYAKAAGAEFVTSHESRSGPWRARWRRTIPCPAQGVGVETAAEFQPEANELLHFGW